MDILAYLLLGVIQGLTEFLPVSSSGHLVLAQHWLGIDAPGALTEVALHVATLLSVIIVYRYDIARIFGRQRWGYLGLLALGTVVTVVLVLPAKDWIEGLTDADYAPRIVGAMLLFTAFWLLLADLRLRRAEADEEPTAGGAVLIGLAQALAILPGISRSGATIGAGVLLGVGRERAARFSFLLSVPVIIGAGVLKAKDVVPALNSGAIDGFGLGLAFVAALLSGVLAIYVVLWLLQRARLSFFAAYCALLGIIALFTG